MGAAAAREPQLVSSRHGHPGPWAEDRACPACARERLAWRDALARSDRDPGLLAPVPKSSVGQVVAAVSQDHALGRHAVPHADCLYCAVVGGRVLGLGDTDGTPV